MKRRLANERRGREATGATKLSVKKYLAFEPRKEHYRNKHSNEDVQYAVSLMSLKNAEFIRRKAVAARLFKLMLLRASSYQGKTASVPLCRWQREAESTAGGPTVYSQ